MSFPSIDLTQYDTVVAVTQNAVNEALATYLHGLQKQVALSYNIDAEGNFVPTPADQATCTFTGTLDYALDSGGRPVEMVVLHNDGGNQTVTYQATFSQAEFRCTSPAFHVRQSDKPWIFQFDVSLALGPAAMETLPPDVRQKVQSVVQNLGPDMFSIQQLYLDLNTAAFNRMVNVKDVSPLAEILLAAMLRAYVSQHAAQGNIVFGYGVAFAGGALAAAPTFMPTSLDFVVTRYTDAAGGHGNPGLDTLNYLVMTGNRPQPKNPPASFGWNWVEDDTVHGTLAVRHDLIVDLIVGQLSPVLKTVCRELTVKADNGKSLSNQIISLQPGTDRVFERVSPARNGVVATYRFKARTAEDDERTFQNWLRVKADYSSQTQIAVSGSTITISGTITASSEVANTGPSRGDRANESILIMPDTTFAWSLPLRVQMDLEHNGQLNLLIGEGDFGGEPTVASHEESGWQTFLRGLSGLFLEHVNELGQLRDDVKNALEKDLVPELRKALSTMNHFVFPGARTFAFKNPQFSPALDLVSNITYLTPSDPAPAGDRVPAGTASRTA